MPKRVKNENDEKTYGLKDLLSDIAGIAGGKKSPRADLYMKAAKNLFSFSGLDQKVTIWFLTKALTNPNIAKTLFRIRGMINEGSSETFLNFSLTVLIPSDNPISKLLGIISIGMIHNRFPLKGENFQNAKSTLKKLLIDEDLKIKDAATVILQLLGDSVVDKESAKEAKERLKKGGIDIKQAIKKD